VTGCSTYWHGPKLAPATDDHPFPYLQTATIPITFRWMLVGILLGSLVFMRLGGGRFKGMRFYIDLAFMGAAFLLLETKNIVQFALLFGTTWFVNSLVFAGVLLAELGDGLRRQPSWRDGRRRAGVPVPDHRISRAADRDRCAVRTGLRDRPDRQTGTPGNPLMIRR
jgi:hypothetical protein